MFGLLEHDDTGSLGFFRLSSDCVLDVVLAFVQVHNALRLAIFIGEVRQGHGIVV